MNVSSLCLAIVLSACCLPFGAGAQTSKSDVPATSTATSGAKPAPASPTGTMQIRKDIPGEFQYHFVSAKGEVLAPNALPAPTEGIISLTVPAEGKGGTLEIQDTARGNLARLPVKTDGVTPLTESSFTFVQVVKIPVTSGGKPVTDVLVTLTSKDGKFKQSRLLQAADAGTARFDNVPLDQLLTASVQSNPNPEVTSGKTITRDHAPDGETFPAIPVDWKNVKTVAAPATPANASVPTAATNGTVPPVLPQTAPTVPAASGGGLGGVLNTLISLGLLAAIAYGLYWAYQNGKIKTLFEKLGIQTAALTPDAGAVAPNPFQKNTTPVQPITDGTADPFAGGAGVTGVAASAAVPVSTGPRLVATMGTYSGQIFPLNGGSAEIGRDTANAIPLPNDTNASRRHATIQVGSGQAMVTDNNSSNGTFVNGVRIAGQTPTPLKPNDELTVGNTRFRFEA